MPASINSKTVWMFLAMALVHVGVFVLLPLTFTEYNDRVNWFAINAIPWWPLYQLDLPVTRRGWLMMPNVLGWIWCAAVWLLFYFFLAKFLSRLLIKFQER